MSHQHRDPYTESTHYQRAWANHNKRIDKIHESNPRLVERYADLNAVLDERFYIRDQAYGNAIGNPNFDQAGFNSFVDTQMKPLSATIRIVKDMMDCEHKHTFYVNENLWCFDCGAVDTGIGWDYQQVIHETTLPQWYEYAHMGANRVSNG